MLRILSFVTNPDILPVLDRVVNKQEGWTGLPAATLREAKTIISESPVDVILLGAGTGATERKALADVIALQQVDTVLIDHYGGGSGLLYAEVMEAIGQKAMV